MRSWKIFKVARNIYYNFPVEAVIWSAGLIVLAIYDPLEDNHMSLCPLNNLGFSFCPGCGLGRSISYIFHGNISMSLSAHPLGVFAFVILSYRIFMLFSDNIKTLNYKRS